MFINKNVSCTGTTNGGHPKIYLTLKETERTICPYCSKIFPFLQPSKA